MASTWKSIFWLGDSLQRVRAFPKTARQDIGFQLDRVQHGFKPRDCRPAPSVELGVVEIGVKEGNNVFRDLGFGPAEAENLRIRAAMMNALTAQIEKKKLTQTQIADLLGVTQPRISDLMRGKIHLFSIDTLVNLLAAAGLKVDLRVSRAA